MKEEPNNVDIVRTRNRHILFVVLLFILFIVLIVNNIDDFIPSNIQSNTRQTNTLITNESTTPIASGTIQKGKQKPPPEDAKSDP